MIETIGLTQCKAEDLLGRNYRQMVEPLKDKLRRTMESNGLDELGAFEKIQRSNDYVMNPLAPLLYMAATAEVIHENAADKIPNLDTLKNTR